MVVHEMVRVLEPTHNARFVDLIELHDAQLAVLQAGIEPASRSP